MNTLTPINRDAIQVGMIIVFIHEGIVDSGKVIEVSPQLKITRCWAEKAYADDVYDDYFFENHDYPPDGIYLCPDEMAGVLVFPDMPNKIEILPEIQEQS